MLPTLQHIPPKSIVHLPGSGPLSSRRSRVTFGVYTPPNNGGVPTETLISNFSLGSGGAPTWFAVSDNGAGYIPWGFWQVALYAPASPLPPANLALQPSTVGAGEPSFAIANLLVSLFNALKNIAIGSGFPNAKHIHFEAGPVEPGSPSPDDDRGQVIVTADYGIQLSAFYSGDFWLDGGEAPLPMVSVVPGIDVPVMLALWSPGNRAFIVAHEPPGPPRYPYDYHPTEPPPEAPIG